MSADSNHDGTHAKWWKGNAACRALGALLLGASYRAGLAVQRATAAPPAHHATPGEFAACAAAFLLLSAGLAFLIEGGGVFRLIPMPPRSFMK